MVLISVPFYRDVRTGNVDPLFTAHHSHAAWKSRPNKMRGGAGEPTLEDFPEVIFSLTPACSQMQSTTSLTFNSPIELHVQWSWTWSARVSILLIKPFVTSITIRVVEGKQILSELRHERRHGQEIEKTAHPRGKLVFCLPDWTSFIFTIFSFSSPTHNPFQLHR